LVNKMISQSAAASETLIYRIENVPLWHICDAQRMSPMSEKQTLEIFGL
jgi:hypothetical protein